MERSQHQGYREDVHQGRHHQAERVVYTHVTAAVIWFPFIFQIKNLKEAETYVFRVRAQNKAGVGKTSDVTEPVPALTKPGEKNSHLLVNWEGIISSSNSSSSGFQALRR